MLIKQFSAYYKDPLKNQVESFLNSLTKPYLVRLITLNINSYNSPTSKVVKNIYITYDESTPTGINQDIKIEEFNFSGIITGNSARIEDALNHFLALHTEIAILGLLTGYDVGYLSYKKTETALLFYYDTPGTPTAFIGGVPVGGGGGAGSDVIGTPTIGSYLEGLFPWTSATRIADAFYDVNKVLKFVAPTPPNNLGGNLNYSVTRYSGYLSQSSLRFDSFAAGDSVTNTIINQNNFLMSLADANQFGSADKGDLEFFLDTVSTDTFDLIGNFNESLRTGNQTYPPMNGPSFYLRILSVGIFSGFPSYQKGDLNIRIGATYGNANITGGEHSTRVVHDTGFTYATNTQRIFYDPETNRPAVTGTPTISENTPSYKWLSGIRYYSTGSTFNVGLVGNYIFEYTYVANPIALSMPGGSATVAWNNASVSGVSNPPVYNEVMTVTNYILTLGVDSQYSTDARLTVVPSDPFGNGTSSISLSENRMVDTFVSDSTELYEGFKTEFYRLPIDTYNTVPVAITGLWDSTVVLSNGNAQVVNGSLIYPYTNYLSPVRLPNQQLLTNYSTFTGNQPFFRAFRQVGTPHNNGSLQFKGITWTNVTAGNVKLELKLPSQTGWLDLRTAYNSATFTGIDNDGCHISHSESGGVLTINWSSGIFSTVSSGHMFILRVTLVSSSINIGSIRENGW